MLSPLEEEAFWRGLHPACLLLLTAPPSLLDRCKTITAENKLVVLAGAHVYRLLLLLLLLLLSAVVVVVVVGRNGDL